MTTKKVNNVSANVAVANANANKKLASEIFKSLNEKTNGLLKTSLGKKTEIYKVELFEGMNDREKKVFRRKVRNNTFSLLDAIVKSANEKNEKNLKTLVSAFKDFYKEVYMLNDFSFASIASENTKDTKKSILVKGLEIAKNFK